MNPLRIGDRVRITESQHVCAYLHGSTGTVTAIADAKPWESTVFGPLLYRIALDVPVAPTPHWTPLESLGGMARRDLEPIA